MPLLTRFIGVAFLISLSSVACDKVRSLVSQTKDAPPARDDEAFIAARRGTLQDVAEWSGVVLSAERIEVKAERAVIIKTLKVENFQAVRKGDLLVEVDRTEQEKRVRELKDQLVTMELEKRSSDINFEQKKRNFQRKKTLADQGIVPRKELEDALRELKLEENAEEGRKLARDKQVAEYDAAVNSVKAADVLAPMDGVVSNLPDPQTAREVAAAATIAVVSNPKKPALWVSVDETQRTRLSPGQTAEIELDAQRGKPLVGTIREVGLTAEGSAGFSPIKSYKCRIDFDSGDFIVQEGFRGTARVRFSTVDDAVVVPLSALRFVDGEEHMLVSGSRAATPALRKVSTGLKTATEIEVKAGVKDGEFVVVGS